MCGRTGGDAKPTLVLLPGTLCTGALFAAQKDALATITEVRAQMLPRAATIAACAATILKEAPECFALGGFSQGGLVALEIMRQAPERVTKLCLLSTNPRGSTQQNYDTWARWHREATSGGFADIVRVQMGHVYDQGGSERAKEIIGEMACATGVGTFLTQLEMLASRTDSRPTLATIGCPTLLVAGCQDQVTPVEMHEEIRAHMPHASLAVVDACGHYSPLEQPRTVFALLREWLEG